MINSVLQYCQPSEWEPASYSSKLYQQFDLQAYDEEYEREVRPFLEGNPRVTVRSLRRIQNPLQLGKFQVRKEQKLSRNETVRELKYYHPVRKADLNVALEYNLDIRRYTSKSGCSNDSKNPIFYKTPNAAYTAIGGGDIVIIVCKILGHTYEGNVINRTNDAEFLPIYAAEV